MVDEDEISIINNGLGVTMKLEHVLDKVPCQSASNIGVAQGDLVCILSQPIDHYMMTFLWWEEGRPSIKSILRFVHGWFGTRSG